MITIFKIVIDKNKINLRGIIHHEYMCFSPTRSGLIQPLDQLNEEDLHNITIVVCLYEAIENLTICVQPCYH